MFKKILLIGTTTSFTGATILGLACKNLALSLGLYFLLFGVFTFIFGPLVVEFSRGFSRHNLPPK